VLVEREEPLTRLRALADEVDGGAGRLALLGGEAGVGKTSLVAALVIAVGDRMTVRRGSCDSVCPAAALGPLVEAVPEIRAAVEGAAGADRPRLFARLRAVLQAGPTLLVLEDLHWADEATLEMLRFLGRRVAGLPVLVVATFRDDGALPGSPLTALLGDLATVPAVARVTVAPLSVRGVQRLVSAAGSAVDPIALHCSTEGNPFFVTEVLAAGGSVLPVTVRDAVLARTAQLSAGAREVLAATAVLGQRADLPLLTAVSGAPPEAVDECVAAGVLVADGTAWRFRHELARLAIEQTTRPGVRAALHARALGALRERGDTDDALLAHHAAAADDRDTVLAVAPRAAARAACLGAHREAADLYRLALRLTEPADERRVPLLEALSYECYVTGRGEEALTTRRAAMELSERAGDQRAVGTDLRWLSRLSWFLGRNADAGRYAQRAVRALETVDQGHELAMAYSNRSQLAMLEGDTAVAVDWGNRAIALARRTGDREVEIHALNNVGTALASVDDSAEGARLLARSLDLALADDAHEHVARAYTNLGGDAVRNRRYRDGDRHLRAGIAYCDERDLDTWALYMSAWLARSLADRGRDAEAREWAMRVLNRPEAAPVARMTAAPVAGILACRRGEPDPGHLAEAVTLAEGTGEEQRLVPVAAARAEAAWLAGRAADVVTEVDRAWATAVVHANPWAVGELSWWLATAGVRRAVPVPVAEPFRLMLDGDWMAAADVWTTLGCPVWVALALGASPQAADGRRALEIVDRLGAAGVRRALLRSRSEQGVPVPRGPRPSSRGNPAGLTAREFEVLRLLAQGLSNADVAGRLFLSEKTVGHHVSAVLRKLGEPTRSRAVAAALRRHMVPGDVGATD
jgi:ATP/maltotriose-dependent transcriptional regulator MalT